MDGVGIVGVDGLPGEVSAIVKQKAEVVLVGAGIERLDELVVLFRRRFDLKGIERAVVCRTDQLGPIAHRRGAVFRIRYDLCQVRPPPRVPQRRDVIRRYARRNFVRAIYRIEVGQQRNRQPIVSGNAVIAADHDSLLTLVASPERSCRGGTNMGKIDCGVPGRIHAPECAIRLLEQ